MRRLSPSRPKPQSVVITSRPGGMYSSALRISRATCSGGSTTVLQWFTTPIAIFLLVRYLAKSGRSRPSELAVERLGQELEVGVGAVGPRGASVVRRLLDLDEGTAGRGQLAELGVHDVAE